MRRFAFLFVSLAVIILDQLSKHWCVAHLRPGGSVPFLDHWLYLTLTYNERGAFSLLSMPNGLFVALIALLIAALAYYALRRNHSIGTQLLLGLILGGGVGNLIDRIRLGSVIDFLDLRWWPVFNIADSAVSVGMVLWIMEVVWKPRQQREN